MQSITRYFSCLIAFCVLCLSGTGAYAQLTENPWLQYGQDAQNTSMSPYQGPEEADILWKADGATPAGTGVIDEDGNIYVSMGFQFNVFNSDGTVQWSDRHEASGSAPAVAADSIIYTSPVNGPMYALGKDGAAFWSYSHNNWPIVYGQTGPTSPTVDESGNMYFGYYDTLSNYNGGALYSFQHDGEQNWITPTIDGINTPAIGHEGNIYVSGGDSIQAFDPTGASLWKISVEGDVEHAVAVDPQNRLYVGTNKDSAGMVYALTSSGEVRWTRQFADPVYAKPAIYNSELIYVSMGEQLMALDDKGETQWSFQANGHIAEPTVSQEGAVYFGATDSTLYALDKTGSLQWTVNGDTTHSFADEIILGANKVLYLNSSAGKFYAIGNSDSVDTSEPTAGEMAHEINLEGNYPNPFNPSTNISFSLPDAKQVTINVYNAIGQKVETLMNRQMTAGTHSVTFSASGLPSGVYIYRLKAGEYSESRKMLLVK